MNHITIHLNAYLYCAQLRWVKAKVHSRFLPVKHQMLYQLSNLFMRRR
jgi:hypothetical protein